MTVMNFRLQGKSSYSFHDLLVTSFDSSLNNYENYFYRTCFIHQIIVFNCSFDVLTVYKQLFEARFPCYVSDSIA